MNRTGGFIQLGAAAVLVLLLVPLHSLSRLPATPWLAFGLLALFGFAALYLRLIFRPFPRQSLRATMAAVGALIALAIAVRLASHLDLHWAIIYALVAVAAGLALPVRPGLALGGLSALLALVTPLPLRLLAPWSPGLPEQLPRLVANGPLQVLFVGLGVVGVRRLLETNAQLQAAREELARLAVDRERHRFARDLHDLLGHSLSLIALKSQLAGRLVADRPAAAAEVRDIEHAARAALREVREAVGGYRRPALGAEAEGARAALDAAGIACQVELPAGALSPEAEATLAWAVREGATNVLRHSRAGRCSIRLARRGGGARLDIEDDGPSGAGQDAGSGLAGLGERIAAAGGRLEAGPLPHGGFRLRVDLPLASSASADGPP